MPGHGEMPEIESHRSAILMLGFGDWEKSSLSGHVKHSILNASIPMARWQLYYHLVWATKYRLPLIQPSWEADLYGYMTGKAHHLGCIIHAINGTEDHIHVVASIPPTLAVSVFVKRLKGSSSHYRNQVAGADRFQWQGGYGVFSLGQRQLDRAVAYVDHQKQHHAQNQVWSVLEPEED
jgi:putative transposase